MTSKTKGNLGLGKAISYFTEQEYTVSLPLTVGPQVCYSFYLTMKHKIFNLLVVCFGSRK